MKRKLQQLTLVLIAITVPFFISSCAGDNDLTQSTENNITQFDFTIVDNTTLTENVIGAIDIDANTIILNVPFGTDITALQPTITISEGATIAPATTPQDFSAPVSYTVTAEAGNTKTYTVTVTTAYNIDSDRAALIAIYNANPQSQEHLSWDITDSDLSNWNGVTLTDGRVTSLILKGKTPFYINYCSRGSLSGVNDDLLEDFSWLQILPEEIGNLTALTYLEITSSYISSIPNTIGNLKKLKHLKISKSYLKNIPEEISNLTKLITLDFIDSSITVEDIKIISKLTQLEHLSLCKNSGVKSLPSEIGNLTKLQSLILNYCPVSTFPIEFGQLTELRTLHINGWYGTISFPNEIGNLTKLESLEIDNGSISSPSTIPDSLCDTPLITSNGLVYKDDQWSLSCYDID